jgi:hypothetical protein
MITILGAGGRHWRRAREATAIPAIWAACLPSVRSCEVPNPTAASPLSKLGPPFQLGHEPR